MPYLLYLQGGPGFEGPRPSESGGWIQRACEEFRVILLDQVYRYFIYSLNTPFLLVSVFHSLFLFVCSCREEQACQLR